MGDIKPGMDFDEWHEAWLNVARRRGHILKDYDDEPGRVDVFVKSGGYCNGPGCTKCGWSACMHCDFDGSRIPVCSEPRP